MKRKADAYLSITSHNDLLSQTNQLSGLQITYKAQTVIHRMNEKMWKSKKSENEAFAGANVLKSNRRTPKNQQELDAFTSFLPYKDIRLHKRVRPERVLRQLELKHLFRIG